MPPGQFQPPKQFWQTEPPANGGRRVKYCIITPCRDEEDFVHRTVESVLQQTLQPCEWVIVDDGSTDGTPGILEGYASKHPWIRVLRRKNRGFRTTGGGAEAFLEGYRSLETTDWDYLVNLDGDLTFEPDYFERCFEKFDQMPRLGIGGGTIYDKVGNTLRLEKAPAFHVRGGTKIYRRECWHALGGILNGLGWDTADEIKANQLGWTTYTFPDLKLIHHRMTGGSWGAWGNAAKNGEANYIVGYHPLFFGVKCMRQMFRRPVFVGAFGHIYGYIRGVCRRSPRVGDPALRAYVRRQQLRRLLGLESIWK